MAFIEVFLVKDNQSEVGELEVKEMNDEVVRWMVEERSQIDFWYLKGINGLRNYTMKLICEEADEWKVETLVFVGNSIR